MLAAGLCRIYRRKQIKVCPFKPQNMSLNSAVAEDGGEIGRAQALQAMASGIAPIVDMNPILLKPNTECGAQVIVHGKVVANMDARDYHSFKPGLMPAVIASFTRLLSKFERVVVEGAGSPAEINLRQGDIANMGFAEAVNCPVLLVVDIERGGAFAHLLGTFSLLSQSEKCLVKGFIINRFRGDEQLLQPGIQWLEEQTGRPMVGVIPYLEWLTLDEEDSISNRQNKINDEQASLKVIVIKYPHMSNATDFDPLLLNPSINVAFLSDAGSAPGADLVILPGSKTVMSDLQWLRDRGWDKYIFRHLRLGGKIIAFCGGLQMLGRSISDHFQVESKITAMDGLALVDLHTELYPDKKLVNVEGRLNLPGSPIVRGYEMHMGRSTGQALNNPAVIAETGTDGVIVQDGQILGTYWHGIFDLPTACAALLNWAGNSEINEILSVDYDANRLEQLDRLADCLENHLDMKTIEMFFQNFHVLPANITHDSHRFIL